MITIGVLHISKITQSFKLSRMISSFRLDDLFLYTTTPPPTPILILIIKDKSV